MQKHDSSCIKVTCYLHKDHCCYGYIINRAFRSKKRYWSEMVWYFFGVFIINRTLDGCFEIKNFSLSVEKYFIRLQHSLVNINFSTLIEKFCISTRPCNILYMFFLMLQEDEQTACSDGTFNGQRYFTCPSGRGFFTLLSHCRQDARFTPNSPISDPDNQSSKGTSGVSKTVSM